MTTSKTDTNKNRIRIMLDMGGTYTAKDLAQFAIVHETSESCPNTRQMIFEMIDAGALIGSSSDGYRNLTTGKEVQQYLNSLLKRQMGVSKRIQAVYDAAKKRGIL